MLASMLSNVEDNNGSLWIISQKQSLRSESLTASTFCYWYHAIFIWGVLHPCLLLLPCSDTPLLIFLLVLLCRAVYQYHCIISFDYHIQHCQLTHWISIWPHFVSFGWKIAEGPRTESIHHQAAASKYTPQNWKILNFPIIVSSTCTHSFCLYKRQSNSYS